MWFRKKDDIEKALEAIDREIEDKAWAEKKAIYGNKFNAPKFYELSSFWPNFWAWFWILIILLPVLIGVFTKTYVEISKP